MTQSKINIPEPIWKKDPIGDNGYGRIIRDVRGVDLVYPYYISPPPGALLRTYPRSGANYLFNLFLQSTGFNLDRTHSSRKGCPYFWYLFEDDKTEKHIFSVVRDPVETITSSYVMGISHIFTDETFDREKFGINSIKYGLKTYSYWYNNLELEKTNIIKYETLIKNPKIVIDKIADILGLVVQSYEYIDNLQNSQQNVKNQQTSNYLVTSKSMPKTYDFVYNYVSKLDLSDIYDTYKKVYNCAII